MYLLEVYVTNAALNVNRPFTYLSETKVDLYCRVRVKFHNGDNLAIVYDIGCTGFFLPALTLQPIVENAVRHGIRETPDGCGTVTIATREFDDRYEITVLANDDGTALITDSDGSTQLVEYNEWDYAIDGIQFITVMMKKSRCWSCARPYKKPS